MYPLVVITGISGSGKSVALNQLEDLGYYCVDNLPIQLLHDFVATTREAEIKKVAVAIDIRTPGDIGNLPNIITALRSQGTPILTIFLEANDQTILQRYSESRRRHPLTERLSFSENQTPSLVECVQYERKYLTPLKLQEHNIDTSNLKPAQLRAWIKDLVGIDTKNILLTFESFAFKIGVPASADLVFDVRCLPNPYYDRELRPLTGRDEPVALWLAQFDIVHELISDIADYIKKWLPHYQQDTRSYLTVAIGCTGGQHRSVYVVEQLAKIFSDHKPLRVRHRAQTPNQ
ncbi:RNase adapter RapZ [Oligella sp. MSHR50489EDL]|uniref:RNase adapter RapZ n=1 Tax=Oligella sp. MSHR50489EDL TaxID=3139409 RepID=UPI003D81C297